MKRKLSSEKTRLFLYFFFIALLGSILLSLPQVLVPVENRHSVTGRNDQKLTNEKSHYQIRSEVLK